MDTLIPKRFSMKTGYNGLGGQKAGAETDVSAGYGLTGAGMGMAGAGMGMAGAGMGMAGAGLSEPVIDVQGNNARTVKIDCPEDLAQERRDYFLAFQVRNRGKPVRYNIKLGQEGSACYTPYRYGKQNLRLPRPLFEDPDASESSDEGGEEDEEEDTEDRGGGAMRSQPGIRSYEYFKAVSSRKLESLPVHKRLYPAKVIPNMDNPEMCQSPRKPVVTSATNPWHKKDTETDMDLAAPSKSLPLDLEPDSASVFADNLSSSSPSLPAISRSPKSGSLTSSKSSDSKVDQGIQTDFPDQNGCQSTKYSKNRYGRKSRKDVKLKLPSIEVTQKTSKTTAVAKNFESEAMEVTSAVVYNSRGDTSRIQRSKSTSLRDMTAAFRESVSKSAESDKDDKRWLEKMNQAIDVIDHNSYDMFARRRKLAKPYVHRPVVPKHERLKDADPNVDEEYNDDCEEDGKDNEAEVWDDSKADENKPDKTSSIEPLPALNIEREHCLVSITLSSSRNSEASTKAIMDTVSESSSSRNRAPVSA